jgi:hypothetical protein
MSKLSERHEVRVRAHGKTIVFLAERHGVEAAQPAVLAPE